MKKLMASAFMLIVAFGLNMSFVVISQAQTVQLPDFTDLVEKYSKAVVNISTVQKARGRRSPHSGVPGFDYRQEPDGGIPDIFRRLFPPEGDAPQPRDRESLGSGFIISKDGYVLTNNHVVEDADTIFVRLNDRSEYEAQLIGRDERSDLALLKVEATDLPALKMGNSEELKVGEWVLAIGSPFGLDYSVTAGIVSAKGRSLPNDGQGAYIPFIQTDVAINPGNSGGPLFNLRGEVVGINSQIYTRSGGFMGLSFAIPANVAMGVVDQLQTEGYVTRGWLGVGFQELNRELAESFGLDKPKGALVVQVVEDGPAEKAGVKIGDIIIQFSKKDIDISAKLPQLVGNTKAGTEVPIRILREGEEKTLFVTLGALPGNESTDNAISVSGNGDGAISNRLGITVDELNDREKQEWDVDEGIVVKSVPRNSDLGLVPGDVITQLDNKRIDSVSRFNEVISSIPKDKKSVPVRIVRRGNPTFLALKVPEDK